ncbi:hypothetical protein [Burkholderia cenocepacia]|jgi:hypothetical protein|uniref:hypothetical protein n=2 Tax=Burkholderia cenocepacia TaxID=95486 RepID=UPI000ADF5654|nr:hypothetical protein [Burkholderia cenocepacia]DAH71631.1 MAG TPA: Putative tail fiber [Caudoviricetes sp.]MCW3588791.1 hypothetical protein [Burkholderia cenocepacia]MCW3633800.1 hypothetical protein [Burkholderia cenocepacia]MCW5184688.1 hypothetical protein [Burkholderia cenocepacia]MEB2545480.1 hypothetical protein [Burkholderia cenocepacia]
MNHIFRFRVALMEGVALVLSLVLVSAHAQTFVPGQLLTAAQLTNAFASVLPLAGGTMTGPLTVPSLSVTGTPVSIVSGGTGANTALGALNAIGAAPAHVATLTALKAKATSTAQSVFRDGYGAAGDGGNALYVASNSACSLNAGTGDNGSQVASSDGRCWLAIPPGTGWDIRLFGAACNGTADDSAAIQAAINAAQTTSINKVFGPAAKCVAQNLTVTANNVGIYGPTYPSEASGGFTLVAATPTSTVLTVAAVDGFTLQNVKFGSLSQQTSGNYLYLTGTVDSNLTDVFFLNGWDPVKFNNATIVRWNGGSIRNWSNVGWTITGTPGVNGGGNDYYASKLVMDEDNASYTPMAGIMILQNGGSITLDAVDILHAHNGLLVSPGSGQFVNWVYVNNSYFDSCDFASNLRGGIGINFAPTGTGSINGGSFSNSWASTCTVNVSLNGTSTSGAKFVNFESFNAQQSAFYINASDVSISNSTLAGASQAASNTYSTVEIGPAANHVTITGSRIGAPVEGYPATAKFNLAIDSGFAGYLTVNGVDLTGAGVTPVYDATPASGNVQIVNSPGYNPVGPKTITVGASPFTYKAGRSPEYVTINGGTVSSVLYGGDTQVCTSSPCSVQLSPGQALQVTYSSTPTMVSNGQ